VQRRRRGLALGLTLFGIGSGAILMSILAQKLIALLGWRATYTVLGLLVLTVSVAILAFFLKESPEGMGLLPDGAIAAGQAAEKQHMEGLAWRDARRDQTFWFMIGAIFLVGASVHGCVLHLAPMLSDQGVSPQRLALAISFLGIAIRIKGDLPRTEEQPPGAANLDGLGKAILILPFPRIYSCLWHMLLLILSGPGIPRWATAPEFYMERAKLLDGLATRKQSDYFRVARPPPLDQASECPLPSAAVRSFFKR
jgi:MFS family permease